MRCLTTGIDSKDLRPAYQSLLSQQYQAELNRSLLAPSFPAGCVLCPLWLPKLSTLDNPADHGGGSDKQVSSSLEEGGGYTQGFSENHNRDQVSSV